MTDAAASSPRQTLRLDSGWRIQLGDIESPVPTDKHLAAYMANKAGYARGAARPSFDDSDWRVVELPHDWSVEGNFDKGHYIDAGFLPRGIAWYRRHFVLDEADRGKYLAIRFDGVATHCTVYVNGHLLHRSWCGYTPFTVDLSDVATFGPDEVNTIAVRVDATYMEGWWYEGAGIYRHVWLIKTNKLHIDTDGVFVRPEKGEDGKWTAHIEALLRNHLGRQAACKVFHGVIDPEGKIVGSVGSEVNCRAVGIDVSRIEVNEPRIWWIESPTRYRLLTRVTLEEEVIDESVTYFGFRTIRFDADQGVFLNDEPVKLFGACNHQDHAGVGVALPDSIHDFRIRRLKEMGCNAYRCAHNPPAPELLDACDRLGMLVMDETRNFGSSAEPMEQLRTMVKRDRNHPSVILWSICNEEAIQGTPVAANIARAMQAEVKKLDPSRPVTAAVSGGVLNDNSIADTVEILGLNYQLPLHDQFHAKHPRTSLVAAETHCVLSTRGVYRTDPEMFHFGSYDEDHATWGQPARTTWKHISERPFVAGLFIWTGFDYRGEPTPHGWPCVNSHWGLMDMCGFEKDAFYQHKAWFTRYAGKGEPFVHLLPHWNWSDGEPVRVVAYTNCDEVELFLDDESLGRKRVDPIEMVDWTVAYRSGAIRAVGYREGSSVARAERETAGLPSGIGLEIHPSARRETIPADGEFALPITVFALDDRGRRVPTASNHISFDVTGPARILGVGNGDPTCHESDKGSSRSLFNGLAQVIVQTTSEPGGVELTARADGLRTAMLSFDTRASTPRPSVAPASRRHFIRDWRMSPISATRPDPNQTVSDQDMNSWERVEPGRPQAAWHSHAGGGWALYRASFVPPKAVQRAGGRIIFHRIDGEAEVFVDKSRAGAKSGLGEDSLEVELAPSSDARDVVVVVLAASASGGLVDRVEMSANPVASKP